MEDFPQLSLLEKQEILKQLFGEADKVVNSEFLSEHTYAVDAPAAFSDLIKEELNVLKLTVDVDFLRVMFALHALLRCLIIKKRLSHLLTLCI